MFTSHLIYGLMQLNDCLFVLFALSVPLRSFLFKLIFVGTNRVFEFIDFCQQILFDGFVFCAFVFESGQFLFIILLKTIIAL